MHASVVPPPGGDIHYPESDGKPLSDNTVQFRWIVVLADNLQALFRDREDVFVCGNQNWYPVEGEPGIVNAPDVYVVFGRPKGDRPSWKQWEEDNVPMTVVFEVRSPNNTDKEMADKLAFYNQYGVEEYYLYDPDRKHLSAYHPQGEELKRVRKKTHFSSPRLGITFDLSGEEMIVRDPDGEPFLTFEQQKALRQQERERAQQERKRAEQAEQRAEQADQRAAQAEQRAARLAELSGKVLLGEASPEEVQELQRLLK